MQIIESTPWAVRSAVMHLESNSDTASFTLFPMIHVGEPAFYSEVTRRLEACDTILCEGIKSPVGNLLTMSYRFYADVPRVDLVLQNNQLNLSKFEERLVHADVTGSAFEKRWSELPFWQRYGLPLAAPLFGLYMRHFGTRADVATGMSMNLKKTRHESLEGPDLGQAGEIILDWRDRHLIDVIAREQAKSDGKKLNIGVLFGARHMRAVLRHLLWVRGFKVVESEWVTVFDL
ncbi:hypothetical protein [Pelagibius sp. Alg239-R121]|uniref:hypothetical protein n=1 Tax=Pelagibius sp. Alg239-R121 TaxID=2993448 RepID=UPI0024A60F26|nr:hypothetical protein [Pelagibius sp. Alg239-R121]